MRKLLFLLGFALVAGLLAACGDNPPPTQIYIVISPTPEPATEDTPAPLPTSSTPTESPTQAVTPATPVPTTIPATSTTATPWSAPSVAQPDIFPTNVVAEVQAAEAVFQHGRMFWLRHNREIWVMVNDPPDNEYGGEWYCYNDTYVEGDPEIDPSLTPPEGLYQPRRGFGTLWRNHPELRAALGWATTPEFELTSHYTYIAGGYVQDNQYFPAAGEHRLTTTTNESISFFEKEIRGDCIGGTWRKAQ